MRDINPVLLRELRGRLRTPRSYWLLCGALFLVSSISLLIYSAEYASMNGQPTFNGSSGHTVFLSLVVTALVVVTAIAPIMAAGSISGERERQTFDLIVLTQLRPIDIVLGKTAATFAYCLLFVTALTPFMAITFLIGGVDIGELAMMYVIIMSTALLYTCIGVYWSTRTQTAITPGVGPRPPRGIARLD
jgi:ABC-type transport system involved in multi-copper enzyme maturation permease subunit